MSIDSVEKYNGIKFQGQQISSHVNHLKIFGAVLGMFKTLPSKLKSN